ncbi:CRISPR-associated endonuclease Cas2 [candidate division KSB1 bacterium]|nr:CRISPR-associated endonuclease Cas2 [candidate division KSB1 bacterium]
MLLIVSYDIPDDKRRTKLAKKLCGFGKRVQYSVFECDLTLKQLAELKTTIKKIIHTDDDSVRIYKLCQTCADEITSYGPKLGWEEREVFIV